VFQAIAALGTGFPFIVGAGILVLVCAQYVQYDMGVRGATALYFPLANCAALVIGFAVVFLIWNLQRRSADRQRRRFVEQHLGAGWHACAGCGGAGTPRNSRTPCAYCAGHGWFPAGYGAYLLPGPFDVAPESLNLNNYETPHTRRKFPGVLYAMAFLASFCIAGNTLSAIGDHFGWL
jgi:hypothetical protein